MKYNQKIISKSGKEIQLRNATASDGSAVLENFNLTHAETDYLLAYPDENQFDAEQESRFLESKAESSNEIQLIAVVDGQVVGNAGIHAVGTKYKVAHRAEFGISVLKKYWGLGIGRALMEACIKCARDAGYVQLELDVVADNVRAISMYQRAGFTEYGRNPKGFHSRTAGFQEIVSMRLELCELEKIAQGNTAEVYVYSDNTICKLFSEGYPYEAVETEYRNSEILHQTTGLSPKAHKIVSINGRAGIVYDRLFGKDLLQEMLENMTDQRIMEQLLAKMVMLQKRLIQKENKECTSYKDFLKQLVPADSVEREYILNCIEALEGGEHICHGDFHPGNVWLYPDGSMDVIDCMNLCKGPEEYDIARTFFLLTEKHNDDETMQKLKASIGEKYLEMMGKCTNEIADYLHVLKLCRKYEI